MRARLALAAACALSLGLAAPASAATTIGETFDPTFPCNTGTTYLQTASTDPSYAVPSAGVITAWRFLAGAAPPRLKFKVGRSAGGNDYTIVGESGLETPPPNSLRTHNTRIPVHTGDVIGFYLTGEGFPRCGKGGDDGTMSFVNRDVAPGTTATFTPQSFVLDVSARLEPDADGDGFGDDTQDQCPTDPTRQSACAVLPPPPPARQCSDGRDNDRDGRTDFPRDPGCSSPSDDNESNPRPANPCTITGTGGNDVLRGTSGRDVICAGGGNDIVHGLGGGDVIRGEGGNDALRGGHGDDRVIGGSGNDALRGGDGDDRVIGGSGNDALDARDGVRGNDVADGGPSSDSCSADPRDVRRSC